MNQTLQSTIWQIGDKVATMLVNLIVGIYLARALGPAGYGALAFILAAYAMAAPVAQLGLNALVTQELVALRHSQRDRDALLANTLALRLVGATIAALLLGVFAWFGSGFASPHERWGLTLLALSLLPFSLQGIEFYFHATMRHGSVVRMRILVVGLFALLKLLAVSQGAGLLTIAALFALEYSMLGFGFLVLARRADISLAWLNVSRAKSVALLKQSAWLLLSGIAAIVYLKIDQVMLSMLAGHTETGVYAVAVRLSEVWYFVATAAVTAMFPRLLKLRVQNNAAYQRRLQQISDGLCWSAVVLALLISLVAGPLVVVLFGADYAGAAAILVIHIWASVFVFMRALVSKWILAEHVLWASLVSHGLGAVINAGLNFWLIPLYGGVGAAVATIIAYALATYAVFFVFPKTRPAAILMTRSLLFPLRVSLPVLRRVLPAAK